MLEINKIHNYDAKTGLSFLDDNSIDCCVTSPPYYGLRDYGEEGQLGLEPTPEDYIAGIVGVMREVKRTLKEDGSLWLNIGDSYASPAKKRTPEQAYRKSGLNGGFDSQVACANQPNKLTKGLKLKDLIGIPWMLAFALRKDGWYLREEIIWQKPNPMPESVKDRCTRAHEYIFHFTKSKNYYHNHEAIKTPAKENSKITQGRKKPNNTDKQRGHSRRHAGFNDRWDKPD